MPLADFVKKIRPVASGSSGASRPFKSSPSASTSTSQGSGSSATPSPRKSRKCSLPLKHLEDLYRDQLSDLGDPELDDEVFATHSRLSLSLSDVLHDPGSGAIAYFVQYLETRDANNLLKFWLDVEGFKSTSHSHSSRPSSSRSFHTPDSRTSVLQPNDFEWTGEEHAAVRTQQLRAINGGNHPKGSTDSFDSGFADKSPEGNRTKAADRGNAKEDPEQNAASPVTKTGSLSADAVEIYQRYIAPDCPYPVPLDQKVVRATVQGICTESGDVDVTCFDLAQSNIVKVLESEYFPDFLQSEGFAKHQLDVLTSGHVQMTDILCNDTLLFLFMEFMEDEGDRDLLEFWMVASNVRSNQDPVHLRNDAKAIYDRFLSPDSPSCIGVDEAKRSCIEDAIFRQIAIDASCFDHLLLTVMRILQIRHMNRFLNSALFRKYLSEVLCRIQTGPFATSTPARKKKGLNHSQPASLSKLRRTSSNTSLSTCSSSTEYGNTTISSQNTLLAMSKTPARGEHNRTSMLSLDAIDPDSIWRRRNHEMTNIGRIDSLGRYRSSVEHLPTKPKSDSKFSRVMKRLVANDIGHVQEELAWQMAEMMIKDVMSVTSPDSPPDSGH